MTSLSPDRTSRRLLSQASAPRKPASARSTMVQLLSVSLVIGLMLVSLDITPGSLVGVFSDIGPSLQSFGGGLWRTGEILIACLLAGGAIVVPAWLIQRRHAKQQSGVATHPALNVPKPIAADPGKPPAAVQLS